MGSLLFKSTVEEEISRGGIAQNKAKFRDDTSQFKRAGCIDKRILPDTDDDGEIQDKTTCRTRETGKLQVASGGNVSTDNINGRRESNTEGGKSGCSTVAPPSRSGADEKDGSLEIHQGDQIFLAKTSYDNDAPVGLHEITPTMEVAENANILNVEADETGQGPLESIAVADEIPIGGDAIASRRGSTSSPQIDRTDKKGNTPLFNAASKGNLKGVDDLICRGANVNKPSTRGRCPLHVAAERGHGNIVNLLISRGADVQVECDIGQTPIHKAAANGHTGIVESLIAHGSSIDCEDQTGWTPFNAAVQHGHLETLIFLLSKEAKQNKHNGRTPLYAAAEFGQLEILQFLISKGADMKSENPSGRIPLHGAAISGDMEIIKYLIQAGSDVNKGTPKGFTPFDAAIKYGHLEVIKYLIKEGSKLKRYDGMTPLYVAAKFGHLEIVKFFISQGADVNEENDSGEIPLHGAAFSSKMEVIEYLIQRGSDVNKAEANGRTPFNAAVQYGHLDAVKYLIEKGAKQNTFDGINPLYAAAQFGHLDIVKFFISKGADVNRENDKGMIPLHGAASRGHIKVIMYLLKRGSDVHKGLAKDWAPIHSAIAYGQLEAVENLLNYEAKHDRCRTKRLLHTGAKFGHLDLVKFLISKGADINEIDEDGMIPLHHAAYGGHLKVMECLIQQGSDVNKADKEGCAPLYAAIQCGHLQAVKYLLKNKANQNKYDGMTPVHAAAKVGHLDLVDFFISEGGNVNEADIEGMIPLHYSAAIGHIEMTRYLIQHLSDINKRNFRQKTPLHAALQNGQSKVAELLVANGAAECGLEVMSPPHDHADEGKLLVSSGCNAKHRAADMQSRADELSSKILSEEAEKDGSDERNSFLSAKPKSPDEREESRMQVQLESDKKNLVENRNTITNTKDNLFTFEYEVFHPPFLHEMKSNHGEGHPSEPFPLTDETRETEDPPSSSWSSIDTGKKIPVHGPSAVVISYLKNLAYDNTKRYCTNTLFPVHQRASPGWYTLLPEDDSGLSHVSRPSG
ncbi:ankyrin-1-like [Lytechinus variegatus]|uniref:ankyrin-1-like n=1 Tax=Lytechinus variegatus TaxID=7654 RepID=UPI001BB10845|nr:ankyrin-1-like [Lytechinus variegatus]